MKSLRNLDWRALSEMDIDAGIAEFHSHGTREKWLTWEQDGGMVTDSATSKPTAEAVTESHTLTGHQD